MHDLIIQMYDLSEVVITMSPRSSVDSDTEIAPFTKSPLDSHRGGHCGRHRRKYREKVRDGHAKNAKTLS
jgi:hypothetical protein